MLLSKEFLEFNQKTHKYRESTLKNANKVLKRFLSLIKIESTSIDYKLFKDNEQKVKANLDMKNPTNTTLAIIKAINYLDINNDKSFESEKKNLTQYMKFRYKMSSSKWEDRFKTLEELQQILVNYGDQKKQVSLSKKLLAILYLYIPPLRPQDYTSLIISDIHLKNKNHINIITWEIYLFHFKTSENFIERVLSVPKFVQECIKRLIQKEDLKIGNFLLYNDNKNEMKPESVSIALGSIYGNKACPSFFRNLYVTEFYHYLEENIKDPLKILLEKNRLAYIMGHSTGVQKETYSKLERYKGIKYSSKSFMDKKFELYQEVLNNKKTTELFKLT